MNILLSEPMMRRYLDEYIRFLMDCVVRFHIYCEGRLGESREDYVGRLDGLREWYKELIKDTPGLNDGVMRWLVRSLEIAISDGKTPDEIADACENLLRKFIFVREEEFRREYLDKNASKAARSAFSDHLYFQVKTHLDNGNYDSAIVEAFKCLDTHLQRILNFGPEDRQFGDSLINKAFAPDTGGLQLNTDPNEQKGLRNFVAGANAIFRNPSAHRSVFNLDLESLAKIVLTPISERPPTFHDALTAQTGLAIVALLMKIATTLALKNGIIAESDRDKFPFGRP
jgi:uncharacterized protein (TIGR02391 family)